MARPRKPRRPRRSRKTIHARRLTTLALLLAATLALWWTWSWLTAPNILARVLFSETANCTPHERRLVLAVIQNRIRQPAFGNLPTLNAVVAQPHAFSCINDPDNTNWSLTGHPSRMTPTEQTIWTDCLALAHNPPPPTPSPSGRPLVYYHDKSINKPASWDNQHWHAIHELSTEHLLFYSITEAHQ